MKCLTITFFSFALLFSLLFPKNEPEKDIYLIIQFTPEAAIPEASTEKITVLYQGTSYFGEFSPATGGQIHIKSKEIPNSFHVVVTKDIEAIYTDNKKQMIRGIGVENEENACGYDLSLFLERKEDGVISYSWRVDRMKLHAHRCLPENTIVIHTANPSSVSVEEFDEDFVPRYPVQVDEVEEGENFGGIVFLPRFVVNTKKFYQGYPQDDISVKPFHTNEVSN